MLVNKYLRLTEKTSEEDLKKKMKSLIPTNESDNLSPKN